MLRIQQRRSLWRKTQTLCLRCYGPALRAASSTLLPRSSSTATLAPSRCRYCKEFQGGLATALLGLLCHFVIAFGEATVFFVASRAIRFLIQNAVLSGVLYGVAVYFFMNRIVLLLSAAANRPFSMKF